MNRLDPILTIDSTSFWESCEREELKIQKCNGCAKLWHPPRPMCPSCYSTEKSAEKLSGKGEVISWIRQVRPASFGFSESPYVILVELDEGVRLVSNLVGGKVPEFGMRVRVQFEKTNGGKAVPVFTPEKD